MENVFHVKPEVMAADFYNALVIDERPDGEKFIRLADASPSWMHRVVRDVHDGMAPDDTKFSMILEVAGCLASEDPERWEEWRWEKVDGLVDIYNTNRVRWLASHLDRAWYVNEALSEFGGNEIYSILGQGQYREYDEIYGILMAAFLDNDNDNYSEEEDDE